MNLTEPQLGYVIASAPLVGIVLGWPELTTALALGRRFVSSRSLTPSCAYGSKRTLRGRARAARENRVQARQ